MNSSPKPNGGRWGARLVRALAGVVPGLRSPVAESDAARIVDTKSEFLAMMSHEIRTPLHGWIGLTELLEATPLDERQRHYVRLLRRTAEHLTQLIGDILDMSRIEAGRLELANAPFNPAHLVEELAAVGEARAAEKGLEFSIAVAQGVPEALDGDARAIRQILFNFLDNAFKYTERGRVGVRLEPRPGGMLRFTVFDTGCGIPADRRDEVFESFGRLDPETAGTGLGLSICRRLAEAMGGHVGVDSASGRGSAFWCELALPAADLPAAAPQVAGSAPSCARVLFADDVELNRLVFRDFLDGTGCLVDEVADGAEAAAMAARRRYDVVVLDLRMPGTDGFEAARAIRAAEAAHGLGAVPIVALTASGTDAERQRAMSCGFTDFLAKPIARHELLAALARVLPAAIKSQPVKEAAPMPAPPAVPAGLEHLLPAFIQEMVKDEMTLRALAVGGDGVTLAEFAHAMRGKCAMFGENELLCLLTSLEDAALGEGKAEITPLIELIIERIGALRLYESSVPPSRG